jgi:hypothetical protein
LPILDLPNSFNPYDDKLYISGIEPSEKGGALIAKGLSYIIIHDAKVKHVCLADYVTIYDPNCRYGFPSYIRDWQVKYPSR